MNGHLTSITLDTGDQRCEPNAEREFTPVMLRRCPLTLKDTIWTLRSQSPRMLPTKVRLGKLNQSLSYDVGGNVTWREVADGDEVDLQCFQYYYNLSTGNMTLRLDNVSGTDETFSYDALNARLYDPAVGRFLSPDPIVQAPDNTQNYNRYNYCLNNLLRYVDEDGDSYWQTSDPDEIRKILGHIQNVGYQNVTINDVMCQWNPWKWHGTSSNITPTGRYQTYDFFCYTEMCAGGPSMELAGFNDVVRGNVVGVKIYHYGTLVDPTMSLSYGHDSDFDNPGLPSAILGVVKNELDKSRVTYSLVDNNGYANINIKIANESLKEGRYNVRNSIKGFAKPLGRIANGLVFYDICETAINGHVEVAVAKGLIAATEYVVSTYVPGGIVLVLGFELLDANFHLTDDLYSSIDASYR